MDRHELAAAIAEEEALLAQLDRERTETLARLEAMKAELAACSLPTEQPSSRSATEKVALFRSLFRGREDVFPRLWNNPRTHKKGYSPACANEWQRGICEKPRVKCGECPHQAFMAVTDRVIVDHLQGRHVIGVYPLLPDETCWFLAADFDKQDWAEDVAAFVETCRSLDVPAAVERSRSGNGAHVWVFFSQPVPASLARQMGCYLLTETMTRRHQLSMDSYDRFFPNQDTMPRGGFGNLIALPLQHGPRQEGNTLFLDDEFNLYPDQWAYLAGLDRVHPTFVEAIAREAVRQDRVIGVRMVETEDPDPTPWTRPPSRRSPAYGGPVPTELKAVLAQRLFIEKSDIPSPLLNQIKRLAAFQNPEFYKKQALRLSTAQTPRVISCAEELSHHVALPRGCLPELRELLQQRNVELHLEDLRMPGHEIELGFNGELTEQQREIVGALLASEQGVLVAPPGTGKTVVGAYLVAARKTNTLVMVHRKPLVDQWIAQLSRFLGIAPSAVGQIGGGKRKPNGLLDVAMIQSLADARVVNDLVANYGQIIVDECHHVPAISFERVMAEVKARFVTGLTATPYRRDGHQPIIHMQCGPIRYTVDPGSKSSRRVLHKYLIVRETGFRLSDYDPDSGIQGLFAAIAGDQARNELIIQDVLRAMAEGQSPLVLTERRDHLDELAERLQGRVRHLFKLHGGMGAKARRELLARIASIPSSENRLILATGRYVGEGFDDDRLDTLLLAMPVSWKGTLVQYAGRLNRVREGKEQVVIYDYADLQVPALARMFEKRRRGYRAIGFSPERGRQQGLL